MRLDNAPEAAKMKYKVTMKMTEQDRARNKVINAILDSKIARRFNVKESKSEAKSI